MVFRHGSFCYPSHFIAHLPVRVFPRMPVARVLMPSVVNFVFAGHRHEHILLELDTGTPALGAVRVCGRAATDSAPAPEQDRSQQPADGGGQMNPGYIARLDSPEKQCPAFSVGLQQQQVAYSNQ